jgi:hypothetical protein
MKRMMADEVSFGQKFRFFEGIEKSSLYVVFPTPIMGDP